MAFYRYSCFFFLFAALSCSEQKKENEPTKISRSKQEGTEISYATGFTLKIEKGIKKMHILNPFSNYEIENTFVLLQKGQTYIAKKNEVVLEVPIQTIVPFSTTFYSSIANLDKIGTIVAISNIGFVFSDAIQQGYINREITQVGDGVQLNIEKLVLLYPDIAVVNGYEGGLDKSFIKIKEAGIPVIVDYDWKETTPLARAEWVKFFGALYNESEKADSIFEQIESNYDDYILALDTVKTNPNVLFSSAYQGTWYIPGGESYVAQFLKDAKGTYPWSNDKSTGSLPLSMEIVASKMLNADVWITPESFSLDNLKQKDARYAEFRPFKEGNVYEHDKRRTKQGGDDFWETGALRVDLILKDYINILHPGILEDETLTFFRKLE